MWAWRESLASATFYRHSHHFRRLSKFGIRRVPIVSSMKRLSTTRGEAGMVEKPMKKVYIAVGSNLGDRFDNINQGVHLLCQSSEEVRLMRTSFLHETAPMYVTDQPAFLNGVVSIETSLEPHELLTRIKKVENELGRNFSEIRNGPRTVDLDIVLCGDDIVESEVLTIPHPRLQEREFVLGPLCEAGATEQTLPGLNKTVGELMTTFRESNPESSSVRILPLPRGRCLRFSETLVMGVLNVTPDSFSDGGSYEADADIAAQAALQMVQDGVDIIDIGGESTRPGAKEVLVDEELRRTIPVIRKIREKSDIPISIDTRHSVVATAAVDAGADIVNDVSGGQFDEAMLGVVADLGVPMVLMHMRGTPETMQSMTDYSDLVGDVCDALLERSRDAELAGIPRWMHVLDPGIGFAKDLHGNLLLLKKFRTLQSKLGGIPLLLGTSRKGFIGKITGEAIPAERDWGTVASCVAALCMGDTTPGCHILRVHNVKGTKQATKTMDAIVRAD